MNAITTTAIESTGTESTGSVSAASRLSTEQRIFCDTFVANGGRGDLAALAAGVEADKAALQGCRWLCRKTVAAYIHELCETFAHSQLPVAIRTLVEIASDKEALRKDRIKAATSLLEHGGMAAPKGGVQVNVGVAVNGQQAQALIGSVWEAKQARLSDIPPAMPDKELKQIEETIELLASPPATHPGGVELQGPVAGTGPLPGYSSANSPETDDLPPAPVDAFKRAFDEPTAEGDE